jgi:hypothetical protein
MNEPTKEDYEILAREIETIRPTSGSVHDFNLHAGNLRWMIERWGTKDERGIKKIIYPGHPDYPGEHRNYFRAHEFFLKQRELIGKGRQP